MLDIKEAVARAKQHLHELLDEEGVFNVGLEEVEYDPAGGTNDGAWLVTLGFSRPWNTHRNALATITGEDATMRAYRTFLIDNANGEIIAVKRREFAA